MKKLLVLPILSIGLAACQNSGSSGAAFQGPAQGQGSEKLKSDPKTRNCDAGAEGPGLINAEKLKSGSRLARHTVWVQMITPAQGGEFKTNSCTGSLIAPNIVLTAAHCFLSRKANSSVRVYFGTDPVCEEVQKLKSEYRPVLQVALHPDFPEALPEAPSSEDLLRNDLAILQIQGQAPASHQPISLMGGFKGLNSVDSVFTAGFGKDTPGDEPPFEDLMLRFGSFQATEKFGSKNQPNSPLLHLHNPQTFVCKGDSGGPSFMASQKGLRQIGVTALSLFKKNDIPCTDSTAIVNLTLHRSWITETAQILSGNSNLQVFD